MPPIPCPSCGAPLPPQPVQCPACRLPLTGPDALRLWEIDQKLLALRTERSQVLVALRASTTANAAAPTTDLPVAQADPTHGSPTVASLPQPPSTAPVTAQQSPRRSWTTQQTLLAVGVLLVLVASSIALAVAWFLIGRYGQMVVMAGLTTLAAWVSLRLSRRGLASSAEALALVAGGMMLFDVAAARRFGLLGLDSLDSRGYTVVAGLLVAVVLAALHRRDQRIAAFALLSLTAASVAWGAVVALADGAAGGAALSLVGAVVFGAARFRLPTSLGLTRRAAAGPASGWAVVALLAATVGANDRTGSDAIGPVPPAAAACIVVLVLLAAAGALAVRRVVAVRAAVLGSRAAVRADWASRVLTGDWRATGLVAVVATLAAPIAVVSLGLQVGATGTAVLATVLGAGAVALLASRPARPSVGELWLLGQAGLAPLLLVGVAAVHGADVPTTITLLVVTVVAATTAVLRAGWRAPATATAGLALLGAVALSSSLASPTAQVLAVTVLGVALSGLALARPRRTEELPSAAVAVLSLVYALSVAVTGGLAAGVVATPLLAMAVVSVATAALRAVVRPAAEGVAIVTGTSGLWLVGGLVSPQVQWTLVAAVAAGLAALAARHRTSVDEVVLGLGAVLTSLATVGVAIERSWPHAGAAASAAYALLAVGYAALPHRRAVVTTAVVGFTGAVWIELLDAGVTRLEAYTLPLAVLLLAAGLWSRRELGDRSWLTAGPALAVALLPSALATAVTDDLLRALLTVTVAVVVLAVGASRRWQALVVLGAVAAALVAVTQLGPVTLQAPRYLTLGTLGVALLLLGARYEQSRSGARRAVSWLSSMS